MDSPAMTVLHTVISLIAITSGAIVTYGLLSSKRMRGVTLLFLVTAGATSATGFLFHRDHILPSHIVGALALVIISMTCIALYRFRLRGAWRSVYVIGLVVSVWLNVFVLIAQAFLKISALHDLAPTGSEPSFAIAQGIVLLLFVVLAAICRKRFLTPSP